MREANGSPTVRFVQAASRWSLSVLLWAGALLLGQAALAQTPPTAEWQKAGYGAGWHPLPKASASAPGASKRSQANGRAQTRGRGPQADASGGGVGSSYSFFAYPSSHNPDVLWFDEHMCCMLNNGDIVPATYVVSSSCTLADLEFGGYLTRTPSDIAYAEGTLWPSEMIVPPYATVDWYWGSWLFTRVPIDSELVCTFIATRDGAQVASIVLTWDPPPETDLGPTDSSDCQDDCSGGGPINFTSGNTYIQQTDINLPGLNGGLKVVRTWNSLSGLRGPDNNGEFGNSWSSTYEERVEVVDSGQVKYRRGDGSAWTFQLDTSAPQNGVYKMAAPANRVATLQSGSLNWTLTFQNGERRFFDTASGWMNAFQDRNHNTTSITHDSLGRIIKVTDPASRHLYFHYDNRSFQQQVSSITSDAGTTVSYTYFQYVGVPRDYVLLNQVTNPDQSIIQFDYDNQARGLILDVSDAASTSGPFKILESHTYDADRRGLTSVRAGGVEALTVTYPATQ